MMHRFVLLIPLLATVTGNIQAAPEPAAYSTRWQLDFVFDDLQRIELILPGDQEPSTFWYLLYTVTNNTGADVEFFPSVELVTERLEVITAGDRISPTVYEALRARHAKRFPFFRSPHKVSGRLLQGPDNARTSAAVFRDFDVLANQASVYFSGLSGEITRLANPAFNEQAAESAGNPRFFPLRKTLLIRYDIPGDAVTRRQAIPIRRLRTWVMR